MAASLFYEAEMGPWTRYLTLRKNNRLFLDQDIHGQTATIFSDYGTLAVWQWKVYANMIPIDVDGMPVRRARP